MIFIHVFTLAPVNSMLVFFLAQGFARLAVPIFFCCSGYFIAQKGLEKRNVVLAFLKKTGKSYLIWSLVYSPIVLIDMAVHKTSPVEGLLEYLQRALFAGSFVHLWYFPALIVAVYSLHLLIKKLPWKVLALFASLLYGIGLLGDAYEGFQTILPAWIATAFQGYDAIFLSTRNGIFFGIPFVLIGVMIAKVKRLPSKQSCLLFFSLSLLLLFLEIHLLDIHQIAADYNMMVFLVPATIFLFLFLLQVSLRSQFDSSILRAHSVILYPAHPLLFGLVLSVDKITNLAVFGNLMVQFLLVWGLSQFFSSRVIKRRPKLLK